jgi:trk system potassium uptake protein TrkH
VSIENGKKIKLHPAQIIVVGFFLLILMGAILLSLPFATMPGHRVSFLDAFFTSTSAVCVTGLVVVDTATTYTLFGQIVVILLIQAGGLGVMTVTTMVFLLIGKRITLSERILIREAMNEFELSGLVKMILKVIKVTAFAELTGAALLSIRFIPMFGLKGIYYSLFHSISAFCNAGFDLMGGEYSPYCSLAPFASDPLVVLTVAALIVTGGLGFMVVSDVFSISRIRTHKKMTRYSKLVLATTGFLLGVGIVAFLAAEWNNAKTLGSLDAGGKILGGVFQSVTPRTAGFNTIDQNAMYPVSKFVTIILMFIGASPAGTGGGIKTTTTAIVALFAFFGIRGCRDITLRGRRVSPGTVQRATIIAMTGFVFVVAACIAVVGIEGDRGGMFTSENLICEVVSGFGTVGLTTGITPQLSAASHIVLIVVMFVGRVGLTSLVVALASRAGQNNTCIRYPEERFMVG